MREIAEQINIVNSDLLYMWHHGLEQRLPELLCASHFCNRETEHALYQYFILHIILHLHPCEQDLL